MSIASLISELDKQTALLSSAHAMKRAPAFAQLWEHGSKAVPALLKVLDQEDGPVIPAMLLLEEITGEDPAAHVPAGDVPAMIHAWKQQRRDLADRYNPDQPREPAGSPEGGQWTSGGGAGGEGGESDIGPGRPYEHVASPNVTSHMQTVQKVLNKPTLMNKNYRINLNKLMSEAKGYFGHHEHDAEIKAGYKELKLKMGESFWKHGFDKIKSGKLSAGQQLVKQAKMWGFAPSQAQETAFSKIAPSWAQPAPPPKPSLPPGAEELTPVPAEKVESMKAALAAGKTFEQWQAEQDEPKATIPTVSVPWKQIGPQKGSNPGGLYTSPEANGAKWYVKTPPSEKHVNADMLARKLYTLAGVPVAQQIKTTLNGKPAVASLIIPGDTLAQAAGSQAEKVAEKYLRQDFAVDAWLGARDVIGLERDNVILPTTGVAIRIDYGGTLMFRAKGEEKEFGPIVPEFHSMRDPEIAPQAAAVFGSMMAADLAKSIDKVLSVSEAQIIEECKAHGLPKLASTLIARRHYLAKEQAKILGKTEPPAPDLAPLEKVLLQPPPGKATPEDLKKAAKTGVFYPAPTSAAGQQIVAPWNLKWSQKANLTPVELEQKVQEYKITKAMLESVQAQEQAAEAAKMSAAQAAAKAAEAEKQKALAEAKKAAKKAEEDKKAAEEAQLKNIMTKLGLADPNDAKAFEGFVELIGQSTYSSVQKEIEKFQQFEKEGGYKGLAISPFQYALIQSYTGSAAFSVNKQLRYGSWTMKTHLFAKAMNKALKAMPNYEGVVRRGTDLGKNEQQLYAYVGNVVEERAFTSSGKTKAFPGNTQWYITSKTGADVSMLSQHASEGEVIFPARTQFRIDKVEGQPGGSMKVWMTEIEAH